MLLDVTDLTVGYGGEPILRDVSLTVAAGEIVCIIGPNGAGKSTVLRAVAGQLSHGPGMIRFKGEELADRSIADRGRRGLVFIPQGMNIFPNLTVMENLEIAATLAGDRAALKDRMAAVFETFPVLGKKRRAWGRSLSGGERQMLALGRIRLLEPELVLLDEPSLGLSPLVVDQIFEAIAEMRRTGASVLLVEQNARKGLSVSDRGYVLELGRNRLTGTGQELLADDAVRRLYLGG